MPNFETFDRSLARLRAQPQVTLLRSGVLSLNRAAYAMLGSPEAVDLLYDADARIVGLRPCEIHQDSAHLVRHPSSGCKGPYLVTAMAFTKFYSLESERSLRWDVYLEDEVLCVPLAQQATVVTSNRARKKSAVVPFRSSERAVND